MKVLQSRQKTVGLFVAVHLLTLIFSLRLPLVTLQPIVPRGSQLGEVVTDVFIVVAVMVIAVEIIEGVVRLSDDSRGEDLVERKDAEWRPRLDVQKVESVRIQGQIQRAA